MKKKNIFIKKIIISANLRARVPLSVLQEGTGQQMDRAKDHVRVSTVSDLQSEHRTCYITWKIIQNDLSDFNRLCIFSFYIYTFRLIYYN